MHACIIIIIIIVINIRLLPFCSKMGIKVLEVLFSGNTCVYKPGDLLTGEVQIVSDKKEEVRCIKLNFVGQSYTHWTETEGAGESRRTIFCTTDYYYFNDEIIIRGNPNGKSDRVMLDGEHRFPFRFQIPDIYLPPPFEGFCGHVRYFVQITLDRPFKFNQHTEKFFSILTLLDLHKVPDVLVPLRQVVEKTMCCLCCESGPILFKGTIDKRGYVPGEYIFVSVNLQNNSRRAINRITVILQQLQFYSAQSSRDGIRHRQDYVNVAELKLAGCEAHGSLNYNRVKMLVPPVPPCSYDNCPNIQVKYHVEITAGISGTCMNAKMYHNIVIGTIPVFQQQERPSDITRVQAPPAPAGETPQPGFPTPPGQVHPVHQVQQVPLPGQPAYPPSELPALPRPGPAKIVQESDRSLPPPPPTYETAIGGPHEMERTEGSFSNILYAPQYPYYDPDTLYAAMGVPEMMSSSQTEGQQRPTPPITTQPISIHQPPQYR